MPCNLLAVIVCYSDHFTGTSRQLQVGTAATLKCLNELTKISADAVQINVVLVALSTRSTRTYISKWSGFSELSVSHVSRAHVRDDSQRTH